MTTRALAMMLVSVALLGCDDSESPTAPQAVPPPPPAPAPTALEFKSWTLVTTFKGVKGPDNCWGSRGGIGKRLTWTGAGVRRTDSAIEFTLVVEDPADFDIFEGTVSGRDFSARSDWVFTMPDCGTYLGASVHGRFSADGLSLVATETSSIRSSSGKAATNTISWTGTRNR